MSDIKYIEVVAARRSDAPVRNRGDYGSALKTSLEIRAKNAGKRWRKVKAICYSNSASLYIKMNGTLFFLHDYEIEEALRRNQK